MEQLLSIFAYLSVVARGVSLSLQTLLIGGTTFVLLVLRPALRNAPNDLPAIEAKIRRLLIWTAVIMAAVQIVYAMANSSILMSTVELRFIEVVGAQFFLASIVIILASIAIVWIARSGRSIFVALQFAVVILLGCVTTGHAWSRIDNRVLLSVFDMLHQAAAGVWIGGLPILLIALGATQSQESATLIARRFSRMALIGVGIVLFAGIGLSLFYLDAPNAVYGTAYGIMLLSKVGLFLVLLGIGAMNKSIVERLNSGSSRLLKLLRRNVEAEIGIGFTVVLAAASLTSQPPAIDLPNDRLSLPDIQSRYTPRWPRLSSPSVSQLKTPTRQLLKQEAERTGRPITYVPGSPPLEPDTPEGKAWSEYNHNWAGLMVFAIGILAVASRSERLKWAGNWPLIFIGLAIFILLRADPENWPLGPNGFWESFLEADVLQHRFFALLIIGFAVFEWRVQTGRSRRTAYAFVFPAVCALGGALLFTHSHSLGNIKEETLIEWSHIPLAFLAVIAGCSRWAELRTSSGRSVFAWIWSVCFVMIGTVLMLYRES
jgi:putative copper resistance protein D